MLSIKHQGCHNKVEMPKIALINNFNLIQVNLCHHWRQQLALSLILIHNASLSFESPVVATLTTTSGIHMCLVYFILNLINFCNDNNAHGPAFKTAKTYY